MHQRRRISFRSLLCATRPVLAWVLCVGTLGTVAISLFLPAIHNAGRAGNIFETVFLRGQLKNGISGLHGRWLTTDEEAPLSLAQVLNRNTLTRIPLEPIEENRATVASAYSELEASDLKDTKTSSYDKEYNDQNDSTEVSIEDAPSVKEHLRGAHQAKDRISLHNHKTTDDQSLSRPSSEKNKQGKWRERRRRAKSFLNTAMSPVTNDPAMNKHLPASKTKRQVSCGGHSAPTCKKCPQGHGKTWCNGDCSWDESSGSCITKPKSLVEKLVTEFGAFQPVRDEKRQIVNVILVKNPFFKEEERAAYMKYKNDILFLGIMSYETFPFPSPNPWARKQKQNEYIELFPGWLNMYREPENLIPKHVKSIEMSQSDFSLPEVDYEKELANGKHIKKFDFVYAMSTGGANYTGGVCTGWGPFAKNWTFAKQALEVMCGDLDMTGVLLGTRNTTWQGPACSIPPRCKGKILQTPFVSYQEVLDYFRESRFLFIPQVYDASPRVITQSMALNVPVLMNRNIVGGWKYINNKTGEFFHDMSDFKQSAQRIMGNLDNYEPREYITENFGSENSGIKLRKFIEENFSDRVNLTKSNLLIPEYR